MNSDQAVDTNSNPSEEAADNVAQDDIGALLDEFEQQTKPSEQPKQELDVKQVSELVQELHAEKKAEKEQAAVEKINQDIDSATDKILDGMDTKVSKRLARGILEGLAAEDPNVKKAFEQRDSNPKAWDAAIKKAQKELKEELSVDSETTSDRDKLASAVRNAQTTTASSGEVDLNSMNDTEFAIWKASLKG